jgi:3-oxoadipate enol-lactonase
MMNSDNQDVKNIEILLSNIDKAFIEIQPLARAVEKPLNFFIPSNESVDSNQIAKLLLESASRSDLRVDFSVGSEPSKMFTSFEYAMSTRIEKSLKSTGNDQTHVQLKVFDILVEPGCYIRAYDSQLKDQETVVLVIPCGMPALLVQSWVDALGTSFRVLTWESRGLFGKCDDFELIGKDLTSQASDLKSLLNHLGIKSAHIMGLCGGAAIALCAASTFPDSILSLSLWHGDYDFGDNVSKTAHQTDLMSMLSRVSSSREFAKAMYALFSRPSVLKSIRGDHAHLMLYPYASSEILYRYGQLNGNIMTTNLQPYLAHITQPTLLVTSKEDHTANPEGSVYAHAGIEGSELSIAETGDHVSLFEAPSHLVQTLLSFLKKTGKNHET